MNGRRRGVRRGTPGRRAALLVVWGCLSVGAGAVARPRFASTNLCTDSMLLELAPAATLSVTQLAHDPALSPLSARAAGLHTNRGLAEELVAFAPDLVFSSAAPSTTAVYARLGLAVEYFPVAGSLADFHAALLRLGQLVDRPDTAAALLADMTRRLAASRRRPAATALLISANGYVPGPETFADDLLEAAGLRNVAADLGLPHGGFVTLERIIASPPDWLVLGAAAAASPAHADEFLHHPALRAALAPARLVTIPEALWACGGTYFADAVRQLVARTSASPAAQTR